ASQAGSQSRRVANTPTHTNAASAGSASAVTVAAVPDRPSRRRAPNPRANAVAANAIADSAATQTKPLRAALNDTGPNSQVKAPAVAASAINPRAKARAGGRSRATSSAIRKA